MSENETRNYEAKCLLQLLSSIVNQTPLPKWRFQPEWGEVYKLADYHRVANVVYYAVIGLDFKGLIPWRKKFEERFHQAVQSDERYSSAMPYILEALEKKKIHCMLPKELQVRQYYPQSDMRFIKEIVILTESGKKEDIAAVMEWLEFEKKENVENIEYYYKIPGLKIGFQDSFTYTNKKMQKYFSLPVKGIPKTEGHKYIHNWKMEDQYIYTIGCGAESYAKGILDIRDMLDLWYYYKSIYEKLDWDYINGEFEKLGILEFSIQIVRLAACWFGDMLFPKEDKLFAAMEKYILSKGMQGRAESGKLLPLVIEVADFYRKDMKKKRRQQMIAWLFPKMEYMDTMFPILNRWPWMLPACHMMRLCRLVFCWVRNRCVELKERCVTLLKEKWDPIRQRIKEKWNAAAARVKNKIASLHIKK